MSVVRNSYTWRAGVIKSDLAPTTRHVLLTLSCHFNDAGEACYPSTKLLAQETGLTERAVITHLSKARELGWLLVSTHGFAGQNWKRNQYVPCFPKATERTSVPSEEGAERDTSPSDKGTEPDVEKALKDVQSNYSFDLLNTTTTNSSGSYFDDLKIEPVIAEHLPQLIDVLISQNITDLALAQNLLDETAGAIEVGIRTQKEIGIPDKWLQGVLARGFSPARCKKIQARRSRTQLETKKQTAIPASPEVAQLHLQKIHSMFGRRG